MYIRMPLSPPSEPEPKYAASIEIEGPDFSASIKLSGPQWLIRKALQDLDKSIGELS